MADRQPPGGSKPVPSRRQRQAERTRRDILDAARERFVASGYRATTVADVARDAGVALQTIYSSVGSKADLLLALLEQARDGADVPELDERIRGAESAAEVLDIASQIDLGILSGSTDIFRLAIETAPHEPDVAAVWNRMMDMKRHGARLGVERLHELGALAPGLDREQVVDAAFAISHPFVYLQLLERGWTLERATRWVRDLFAKAFLAP